MSAATITPHFGSKPIFGGTAIESQFENRNQPFYVEVLESVVQGIVDSVYNVGQLCAATSQEFIGKATVDYSRAPVIGAAIGVLRSFAQRLVSLHSIAMKDSIELTKKIRVKACLRLRISIPIREIFVKDLNLKRLDADDMIRITKYTQIIMTGLLSTATLVATLYGATVGSVALSLGVAAIVGYSFYSARYSGGLTATALGAVVFSLGAAVGYGLYHAHYSGAPNGKLLVKEESPRNSPPFEGESTV